MDWLAGQMLGKLVRKTSVASSLHMGEGCEDTWVSCKCLLTREEFSNQGHSMTHPVDSQPLSEAIPVIVHGVHEQSGHVVEVEVL